MLDYVLVFSLPKLVFDDEMCGQALHLVRDIGVLDDLPVAGLIDHLLAENHLIMAEHTTTHWPKELWLTSPVIDRDNRETWERRGAKSIVERCSEDVETRLAAYEPVTTDPAIVEELRAIVSAGITDGSELPFVPEAAAPAPVADTGRRRNRRRGRGLAPWLPRRLSTLRSRRVVGQAAVLERRPAPHDVVRGQGPLALPRMDDLRGNVRAGRDAPSREAPVARRRARERPPPAVRTGGGDTCEARARRRREP